MSPRMTRPSNIVLVVDDSPYNVKLLEAQLRIDRYEVVTAFGGEEGTPLRRVEVEDVLQFMVKAVAGAGEDILVVGVLVLVPKEERLHARALQGELQLVRAVGGVDVDQGSSGAGDAHVHDRPFNAVGRPETDAVAFADTERPETAGNLIGGGAQFGPGEALLLMAAGHGQAVGKTAGGAVEQRANGEIKQRTARSARVAYGHKFLLNRHSCGSETTNGVYTRAPYGKL